MGDKIKPHPSDCATCAPGSPALLHAASNAAAERAAAERERVAFLRAKCADLGEALASAIDERGVLSVLVPMAREVRRTSAERDEARAKLSEVERERDAERAAAREARVGWRVSERLRGQAEGEVARLRCFAEGLAQGLSVPAAGASSGLCRVCLTARPPLAEVATVTTRGASGELLHFCDECWGLTAARHSGVAR